MEVRGHVRRVARSARGRLDGARRAALRRLPRAIYVPWLARRATARWCTLDHFEVAVPDPYRLDVYWLRRPNGDEGPAASLWDGPEEIVRIDGLLRAPHVHYDMAESRGRRSPGVSVRRPPMITDREVADWGAFELEHNLPYALTLRHTYRPGRTELRPAWLVGAADELRQHWLGLLERHRVRDDAA